MRVGCSQGRGEEKQRGMKAEVCWIWHHRTSNALFLWTFVCTLVLLESSHLFHYLRRGCSSQELWAFRTREFSVVGAVLCILGQLVASMACTL